MKEIVLSDVDGTIVKGSLVLDHACSLHERGIIDLGELPEAWKNDQKNETLIGKLAEAYREAITGKSSTELGISEFLDELFEDDSRFYSTIDRLSNLLQNGAEVHLISGSPNFLVGPFARRLKMKSAGSLYRRTKNGLFTGECKLMATQDAKRNYVSKLSIEQFAKVYAFGDTMSDSALFEKAHHSVLVAPNEHTESQLKNTVTEIIRG